LYQARTDILPNVQPARRILKSIVGFSEQTTSLRVSLWPEAEQTQ